jgi:hypothetical protein
MGMTSHPTSLASSIPIPQGSTRSPGFSMIEYKNYVESTKNTPESPDGIQFTLTTVLLLMLQQWLYLVSYCCSKYADINGGTAGNQRCRL